MRRTINVDVEDNKGEGAIINIYQGLADWDVTLSISSCWIAATTAAIIRQKRISTTTGRNVTIAIAVAISITIAIVLSNPAICSQISRSSFLHQPFLYLYLLLPLFQSTRVQSRLIGPVHTLQRTATLNQPNCHQQGTR